MPLPEATKALDTEPFKFKLKCTDNLVVETNMTMMNEKLRGDPAPHALNELWRIHFGEGGLSQTRSFTARAARSLLQADKLPAKESRWICYHCNQAADECKVNRKCPGMFYDANQTQSLGCLSTLAFRKQFETRKDNHLAQLLKLDSNVAQAYGSATMALHPSTHVMMSRDWQIRAFAPTSVQVYNIPVRSNQVHFRHAALQLDIETLFNTDFKEKHPLHAPYSNEQNRQFSFELFRSTTVSMP